MYAAAQHYRLGTYMFFVVKFALGNSKIKKGWGTED